MAKIGIKWFVDDDGERRYYFIPAEDVSEGDEVIDVPDEQVPAGFMSKNVSPPQEEEPQYAPTETRTQPAINVEDDLPPLDDILEGPSYEEVVARRAADRREGLDARREDADYQATVRAIDAALEPQKQMVKSAIGDTLGGAWDIGAILAENAPRIGGLSPLKPPVDFTPAPQLQEIGSRMRATGEQVRRNAVRLTGAKPEPENFMERIGDVLGSSIAPGKNAGKITAIMAGGRMVPQEIGRAMSPPSIDDFKKVPEWLGSAFISPAGADTLFPESVTHTVAETQGGPTAFANKEYNAVGALALATAGMVFGPMLYRRFKTAQVPSLRPVTEAAPGTVAISRPGDLGRTYDDANAGALRVARRTGMVPSAVKRIQDVMNLQTRATANAMVDSAIYSGTMNTPSFQFRTRGAALGDLSRIERPEITDYMHVLDTIDDIKAISIQQLNRRTPQAGPITVRGMDLPAASAAKRAMEQAHPEVAQWAQHYRENLKAMRKFEAEGEYATIAKGEARMLNAQHKNTVPFNGSFSKSQRPLDQAVDRDAASVELGDAMRVNMRRRLENEATGIYVDEVRKVIPGMFTRVTGDQLERNPHWRKNVVTFYRRGVKEHYTTDPFLADVLRMDPYYMTSMPGQLMYGMKRLTEVTTTGELAPWFAVTSFIRSWQIGKLTAEQGMRSPGLMTSTAAIPQQLYPQLAREISTRLDTMSAGWLGRTLGPQNLQGLSRRLAHHYEQSLYAQLQTVGGGRGSILQQQVQATNNLQRAINKAVSPGARAFLESYRALLNSIHNAPSFAYARKNIGKKPLPELARSARHLTGDPRTGGQFFTKGTGTDRAIPIRFLDEQTPVRGTFGMAHQQDVADALQKYGAATELGRTAIPWFNATVQGVKRIGEAYLENPTKFTGRMWLYQIAPAVAMYSATKALGNDPNGRSYTDHMMNGRSAYNKMMNFYIPLPGRPAEEGIEFPRFHEMSAAGHMTEVALDHLVGSPVFNENEDIAAVANNFMDIAIYPPMPPLANVIAARFGMVGPQGVFSGEAYPKRGEAFDQLGGMPTSIELYARALAPGLADIVGNGYAAYTQTPEGVMDGLLNASSQMGKRMIQKTPVLRDVTNVRAAMTGNTDITAEMFKKQGALKKLDSHYKRWVRDEGLIYQKPRSASGELLAVEAMGERPPSDSAGMSQPPPTNPLYNLFIEEMHDKFFKDAPTTTKNKENGGIGFLSFWQRYSIATANIARLRKVNDGNNVTWQRYLEQTPKQRYYLQRNNVDTTNINEVRNFYERQRQDAAKVILKTVRDVEKEFSERLGRPMTIEDLDPYGKGLDVPEPEETPDVSPVQPY